MTSPIGVCVRLARDSRRRCRLLTSSLTVVLCLLAVSSESQPRSALGGLTDDLTPVEVQQLFDAFELVRAQEMLGLTDEQYPDFVARLKRLQDARRSGLQRRQRHLRELQRLSNQPNVDESVLEERLAALKVLETESAESERLARLEIDGILTIRQQVRFRVFERAMERRRVDLLMRARRDPRRRQRDNQPPP